MFVPIQIAVCVSQYIKSSPESVSFIHYDTYSAFGLVFSELSQSKPSYVTYKKIAKAILRSDQVSFIPHSFGWRLIFQKMDHFYCSKLKFKDLPWIQIIFISSLTIACSILFVWLIDHSLVWKVYIH